MSVFGWSVDNVELLCQIFVVPKCIKYFSESISNSSTTIHYNLHSHIRIQSTSLCFFHLIWWQHFCLPLHVLFLLAPLLRLCRVPWRNSCSVTRHNRKVSIILYRIIYIDIVCVFREESLLDCHMIKVSSYF